MKSVFEEAASIIKAIEKGWEKAGQPKKFSVTILENPEKNFFGMTKRSAKIGIFFEGEKAPKVEEKKQQPQQQAAPDKKRIPRRGQRQRRRYHHRPSQQSAATPTPENKNK